MFADLNCPYRRKVSVPIPLIETTVNSFFSYSDKEVLKLLRRFLQLVGIKKTDRW